MNWCQAAGTVSADEAERLRRRAAERPAEAEAALAESSLEPRLAAAETGAAWTWVGDPEALDSLLSPILLSALKVMLGAEGRPDVRQCAAPGCRLRSSVS